MREFSTPLTIEIPTTGNLTDDVVTNARELADAVVLQPPHRRRLGRTSPRPSSSPRSAPSPRAWSRPGVEAGDRVALISKTRYEWTLLDYAIWFAGAVTVPVYETSSAEQIAWILEDSGARAVVAESADHVARVDEARGDLAELDHVWSLDDNAVDVLGRARRRHRRRRSSSSGVRTATPLDLATLIYTSGTTGRPKGCMLTHGNFMFELGVAVDELERLFDHRGRLDAAVPAAGARLRPDHPGRLRQVADPDGPQRRHQEPAWPTSQEFQPTFILAVPRVFEKVFNTASQQATADGRGKIFDRAADVAIAYSPRPGRGRPSLRRARPARRLRPPGLRQAPRRARRPAARTPSPAARRSATGSATSTAASA